MIYNMRGDAYHAGPVMLSDVYTSAVGSAKDGVAASQRALYDAYNSLNSSISSVLKSQQQLSDLNDAPFAVAFAPDTAANKAYSGCWSTVITYGTVGNAEGVTEKYKQQIVIPWYYGKQSIALRQKDKGTWGNWEYFVSASGFMTKRDAVVNDSNGIAANASKTYTPSPLTVSGYRPIMFSYLGGPYMDFCTFNFGDTVISGNSITFGTFYIVNRSTSNLPALMVMMQSLWVPISG